MEASRPPSEPTGVVQPDGTPPDGPPPDGPPRDGPPRDAGAVEDVRATSFLQRASLRRRLRYLRRRRELALRELGELVLESHRRGEQRSAELDAKLTSVEHHGVHELRDAPRERGSLLPALRDADPQDVTGVRRRGQSPPRASSTSVASTERARASSA